MREIEFYFECLFSPFFFFFFFYTQIEEEIFFFRKTKWEKIINYSEHFKKEKKIMTRIRSESKFSYMYHIHDCLSVRCVYMHFYAIRRDALMYITELCVRMRFYAFSYDSNRCVCMRYDTFSCVSIRFKAFLSYAILCLKLPRFACHDVFIKIKNRTIKQNMLRSCHAVHEKDFFHFFFIVSSSTLMWWISLRKKKCRIFGKFICPSERIKTGIFNPN